MYLCVPHCMEYVFNNFWCSNSKNLYVPMFHPMLYDVFHHFSSMLPILHVQSICQSGFTTLPSALPREQPVVVLLLERV
jgi:hypothetical protein